MYCHYVSVLIPLPAKTRSDFMMLGGCCRICTNSMVKQYFLPVLQRLLPQIYDVMFWIKLIMLDSSNSWVFGSL